MSSMAYNVIGSQPNVSIDEVFNSFEQCNKYLYGTDDIDLEQYCEITHNIKFDTELIQYLPSTKTKWLRTVISMFIRYARYDIQAFSIPVGVLDTIGIDIADYSSKIPKWLQEIICVRDDNMKRELRMLKKNGLKNLVDYNLETGEIDNDVVSIGYYITRLGLYKIITNLYGSKFLESIISRMCQILYFFNDYKCVNHVLYIERLKSMCNDEEHLSDNIMRLDDYGSGSFNRYLRGVDDENPIKMMHRRISSSSSSSNQYNYKNDDICSIHRMIESSIGKVDTRISELHGQLADIMSKIDNIVSTGNNKGSYSSAISISSKSDELDDLDDDDDIESVYLNPSPDKKYARSFIAPNTPRERIYGPLRNTCIGNEHQF